ncbi:MAG TPA: 4Fe-4S binding protein [Candidatus Hydrogenedentes bacterium]|nr:4Fe-4S binding protein [Candidatus Hydrogenedentota bacterium]
MTTTVEELYHGKLTQDPSKGNDSRLFVNLDICSSRACFQCTVQCSYFYHPGNNGMLPVMELATYALVCRRCEEPHCVNACPREALEQQKDKGNLLIRHTLRCVSCKTCSHACPYGTIYPEYVPLIIHNCDFCFDRRSAQEGLLCVATCPHGALSLRSGDCDLDENTFLVGDHLIVHSTHWRRENV